jgi:hypothetical protein
VTGRLDALVRRATDMVRVDVDLQDDHGIVYPQGNGQKSLQGLLGREEGTSGWYAEDPYGDEAFYRGGFRSPEDAVHALAERWGIREELDIRVTREF